MLSDPLLRIAALVCSVNHRRLRIDRRVTPHEGATVHPLQKALLIQLDQVAPDRHLRNVQVLGKHLHPRLSAILDEP